MLILLDFTLYLQKVKNHMNWTITKIKDSHIEITFYIYPVPHLYAHSYICSTVYIYVYTVLAKSVETHVNEHKKYIKRR